jgi:hypothetical protein
MLKLLLLLFYHHFFALRILSAYQPKYVVVRLSIHSHLIVALASLTRHVTHVRRSVSALTGRRCLRDFEQIMPLR